jgi:PilZ domain-containing protein
VSEVLPQPGVGVELRDEDGGEHRTVVQAVADGLLTVRRPAALPPGVPLLIGAGLLVSWSSGENAVAKVAARITAIRYDGDLLLWDLGLLGEPWQEQRRRWVRVALTGPITVTEVVDEARTLPPGVEHGELLDISEVALRCVIPAGAIWASRRNARVSLSFALPDQQLELVGRVLTSRIPAGTPNRREVVAQFEPDPAQTEALRRYVAGHRSGAVGPR